MFSSRFVITYISDIKVENIASTTKLIHYENSIEREKKVIMMSVLFEQQIEQTDERDRTISFGCDGF